MPDSVCYFNGIDGTTGEYLVPPMPVESLARIAREDRLPTAFRDELRKKNEFDRIKGYQLEQGREARDLGESGWGVILPAAADKAIRPGILDALGELINHRKSQAGDLYKPPEDLLYRPNETKDEYLERHGVGPGPVDPTHVPYYLLIVADPLSIPFRFQYEMDVQFAVGRIDFRTLDEYARYAASVVAAETGKVLLPRTATFFGVANNDDPATEISTSGLIEPLANEMAASPPGKKKPEQHPWQVTPILRGDATKSRLVEILGGKEPPSLLFTASHGVGFPCGNVLQPTQQGALLCSDWPGPWSGPSARSTTWIATITYATKTFRATPTCSEPLLSCSPATAGTPRTDDFARRAFKTEAVLSPRPFLAQLPMKMLSLPKGGALAVIGHIDRAWSYSFNWSGNVAGDINASRACSTPSGTATPLAPPWNT